MFGPTQVHGPAASYAGQQVSGPPAVFGPAQVTGAQAYYPTQTTGFDMTAMMNMIMMIVMLGIMVAMIKPMMGAVSS